MAERIGHNHPTRDIKMPGMCPACDDYWRGQRGNLPALDRLIQRHGHDGPHHAIVLKSELGNDWTAEAHVGHAVDVSEGTSMKLAYYGELSHPDCNEQNGHVCVKLTRQTCWTEGCEEQAGTLWGPYWCPDHDAMRLDRIRREMAKIQAEVEKIEGEIVDTLAEQWPAVEDNPEPERVQCLGLTAKGERCKKTAIIPDATQGYYCSQHLWQDGTEDSSL